MSTLYVGGLRVELGSKVGKVVRLEGAEVMNVSGSAYRTVTVEGVGRGRGREYAKSKKCTESALGLSGSHRCPPSPIL